MNLPYAWSYSSLTKFETCPYQYHEVKIAKSVKEEQGPEALWGSRVHTGLELRVRDKTPLPDELVQFEELAALFDGRNAEAEKEFFIDEQLRPVETYKEAWCIGIIDVYVEGKTTARQYDWKTGKVKRDIQQMQLYSGLVMQNRPHINLVHNTYIWLKGMDDPTTESFTRKQLPEIWQNFIPRVQRLEQAFERDKWPTKPSGLCNGWCPVKHCKHWRPKR